MGDAKQIMDLFLDENIPCVNLIDCQVCDYTAQLYFLLTIKTADDFRLFKHSPEAWACS